MYGLIWVMLTVPQHCVSLAWHLHSYVPDCCYETTENLFQCVAKSMVLPSLQSHSAQSVTSNCTSSSLTKTEQRGYEVWLPVEQQTRSVSQSTLSAEHKYHNNNKRLTATHCRSMISARIWCWFQRSLSPAGWPWLQLPVECPPPLVVFPSSSSSNSSSWAGISR